MNQVLCGYRGGTIFSAQSVTKVLCSLGTSDSQVVSCTSQTLCTLQCPLEGRCSATDVNNGVQKSIHQMLTA